MGQQAPKSLKSLASNIISRKTAVPRPPEKLSPVGQPISDLGQCSRGDISERKSLPDWPPETARHIEWFRNWRPPVRGFYLRPGVFIRDPARWRDALASDIAEGPDCPRARYGAVHGDLQCIWELFENDPNNEVLEWLCSDPTPTDEATPPGHDREYAQVANPELLNQAYPLTCQWSDSSSTVIPAFAQAERKIFLSDSVISRLRKSAWPPFLCSW